MSVHWLYWKSSTWLLDNVIIMLKWRHHVMSHLSIFKNFWEQFFKHKMRYLMVSKKKNSLFVLEWNRKIRPSWSPFVITRQASWCQTVILGTDISIPPSLILEFLTFVLLFKFNTKSVCPVANLLLSVGSDQDLHYNCFNGNWKAEQPASTQTANGGNKRFVLHVQLGCGSLSITTPMSLLANELDVRNILHGQVSLAAVNQICVIHESMNS